MAHSGRYGVKWKEKPEEVNLGQDQELFGDNNKLEREVIKKMYS